MVGLVSNFSNVFLMAKPELRRYEWVQCSKHYVVCKAIFSRSSLFAKDTFKAGLTLIEHIVCVLVDYTPLIGRIFQLYREKYNWLYFRKIAIETAREANREAAPKIDIRISCLNGEAFNINVSEIDTVCELKESIARERELHISCIELFSLINGEAPFRASNTLADLGVIENKSIFMVLGPDNKAALEALYNSCSGPQWRRSDGWMVDPDISNRFGAGKVCGRVNKDGRVTGISLNGNQLGWTIPPQIGSLNALTWLDLGNNGLTGSIPEAIGDLTELEDLDLRYNRLTGRVPAYLHSQLAYILDGNPGLEV